MRRSTVTLAAALLPFVILTSACSSGNSADDNKAGAKTQTVAPPKPPYGETFINGAVKFTCPKAGEGQPERSFYLRNEQVTAADIKFGTELTVGNASVTPVGCTWGYDYVPDTASARALPPFPELFVTPHDGPSSRDEFSRKGSGYEQDRSSPMDDVQLRRGETTWMVLRAPNEGKSIKLTLSCPAAHTDHLACVTNWDTAQKNLHKIVQQP